MSTETQSRPPASRGRSTTRGGRSGRGRSTRHMNGDAKTSAAIDTSADEGELGEMKRQYASQISTLKEWFPDWSDVDLVLAVQESDGDLERTIVKITEGHVSQFSEIKSTKDRARSKVKEPTANTTESTSSGTRAGRGRGAGESTRGGRSRGERGGRGGHRGGRGGTHATTNGSRAAASVPTTESDAWDASRPSDTTTTGSWPAAVAESDPPASTEPTTSTATTSAKVPEPAKAPAPAPTETAPPKKTWASMFAQPKPAPAPKPAVPAAAAQKPVKPPPEKTAVDATPPEKIAAPDIPPVADEVPPIEVPKSEAGPTSVSQNVTPSADELTEDNVEALPDTSRPAPTDTAASTGASSVATPLTAGQQAPIGRPAPATGYAATALKATTASRSASYNRKIMEQQEAVVMPGNHAVDRAAVQFGSMGLNGDGEADEDESEEAAETRAQPPQHSPPAQPRTSLPPAPRQAPMPVEAPAQEAVPATKPAPGLPSVPQQPGQSSNIPQGPASQQFGQFGRYGQPNTANEPAGQKPYDLFNQQTSQPGQFENYPAHSQAPGQGQQQAQAGGFSSANDQYSSFYTDQQRQAYQNYYGGNYGQQGAASSQDAGASQQRTGSAFGNAPGSDSNFPAGQTQPAQNRFGGDAQTSGHNTPNPPSGAQQPTGTQAQHIPQNHGQTSHGGGYPYNHPYYQSPYWQTYMNSYNAYGGYGGYNGRGMHGQPQHGFGMSPHSSFEQHSSSPANMSGFGAGSMHGRDSGFGGGLGDYGRSGSAQPSQGQQHGASSGGFGGMGDMFSRSQGGFPGQNQPYQQQAGGQSGVEDSLKPFGDSKANAGPSPSALGQPGRPGSATNNTGSAQTGQSGLPPPQSHQQGFGGYPSHLGAQGSQYGGLGGLGGHQTGAQNQGGYGGGYGNSFGSYGSYGRGGSGWGTQYTH